MILSLGFLRGSRLFLHFWLPEFLQTVHLLDPTGLGLLVTFVEWGALVGGAALVLSRKYPRTAYRSVEMAALSLSLLVLAFFALSALATNSANPLAFKAVLALAGCATIVTEYSLLLAVEPSPSSSSGMTSGPGIALQILVDSAATLVSAILCFALFRGVFAFTWVSLFRICGFLSATSFLTLVPLLLEGFV